MKFTGQIRIPDLDHPGVPATFVIEGAQAEVILEGEESLGRWSLFDVRARRLISSAFQVEFDGEEVTFIADEPIDFAYRGVEKMAETWARFKSMNIVRRAISVPRSRRGTLPSRIPELRAAMEENLGVQPTRGLAGAVASPSETSAEAQEERPETVAPADEPQAQGKEQPSIPLVSASAKESESPAMSDEAEKLAAERKAIEEERERLEEQRRLLEELKEEAERREADRVQAFRLEMKRLEEERREYERLEKERQASMREAMERLEVERGEIEKKSAAQQQRESEDFARAAALRKKMSELEEERARREQEEAERVAAARREMEQLEEQRRRIESLEAIKGQEAADTPEPEEIAQPAAKHVASESHVAPETQEPTVSPEVDQVADAREVEEPVVEEPVVEEPVVEEPVVEEPVVEEPVVEEPVTKQPVPAGTNGSGTVVDLGELEQESPDDDGPSSDEAPQPKRAGEPEPAPEPAMAGASRQSGIMGAVRAAFGRGTREHVHDFVDAPGGIGIARSICRECGYVSITTED